MIQPVRGDIVALISPISPHFTTQKQTVQVGLVVSTLGTEFDEGYYVTSITVLLGSERVRITSNTEYIVANFYDAVRHFDL